MEESILAGNLLSFLLQIKRGVSTRFVRNAVLASLLMLPYLSSATTIAPTAAATAAPSSARSASNSIYLVAGTGAASSTGTGGKATAATFNTPRGMWQDSLGVMFIVERSGFCVRKFGVSDAIVANYAGQCGSQGSSGDGGAATAGTFNVPMGVSFNTVGVMYVGDYSAYRLRSVSATGILGTYAGTGAPGVSGDNVKATSATFNGIVGVWVNTLGVVYVADYSNHFVKAIATNGILNTVAGVGGSSGSSGNGGAATSALLFGVERVHGDTSGVIYIGDGCKLSLLV